MNQNMKKQSPSPPNWGGKWGMQILQENRKTQGYVFSRSCSTNCSSHFLSCFICSGFSLHPETWRSTWKIRYQHPGLNLRKGSFIKKRKKEEQVSCCATGEVPHCPTTRIPLCRREFLTEAFLREGIQVSCRLPWHSGL